MQDLLGLEHHQTDPDDCLTNLKVHFFLSEGFSSKTENELLMTGPTQMVSKSGYLSDLLNSRPVFRCQSSFVRTFSNV